MLRILAPVALFLSAAFVLPSAAFAEVAFVPNGRLGLDLPPGFTPATQFPGFENLQTGATFLLVERPREAWARLRGSFTDTNLKAQGIDVKTRENLKVGDSDAVLLIGTQTVGPETIQKWILIVGDMTVTPLVTFQVPPLGASQYTPEEVRKALLSLQIRPEVTMAEQVAALPFDIGDISGFHVDRTMEGKAAILAPDPSDTPLELPPVFVVVAMSDRIPPGEAANDFAKQGLLTLSGTDDIEIDSSKAMDFNGAQGHEIVAHGVDRQTAKNILIVQWLRPLPDGMLRYVGIGPVDAKDILIPNFTRLRDAIIPKATSPAATPAADAPAAGNAP